MVSLILIHWIAIYPVDSAIHLLNNLGLKTKLGNESVNEKRNTFCGEGDWRKGAWEKRGRKLYGRGEYRGPEAGYIGGKLCKIAQTFAVTNAKR